MYFPNDCQINNNDIRFARALKSIGASPLLIYDTDSNSRTILKNNAIVKVEYNMEEKNREMTNKTYFKYYCSKCDRILNWKEITQKPASGNILLGFLKNDNKFLVFPFYASRKIPEKWIRIEGSKNVFYMDIFTYHIFKSILKKGEKIEKEVIDISFPNSLNYPLIGLENIGLFTFKFWYNEKYCNYCKNKVHKNFFKGIIENGKVVSFLSSNGKMYGNGSEMLTQISIQNENDSIFVPKNRCSEKVNPTDKIRKYVQIDSSEMLLRKTSRMLRNMKNLSARENDYMDAIAISYIESIKRKIIDIIKEGDYKKALNEFYNATRIFDKFFIQGIRRYYGAPKVAIDQMNQLFESLFNGNIEEIKISDNELPQEWQNFIDLYLNVEKLKAKIKGRRYQYSNIVISTVSPLPPEIDMKNILNVREIQLIKGLWHGVKFVIQPNMDKIGKYYKNYAPKIAFMLSKKEAKDILKKIESVGYYLGIEGQSLRITREMVTIIPQLPEGYHKGIFRTGEFYLKYEGDKCQEMVDDIIRKINYERSKMRISDQDIVDVVLPNSECNETIEMNHDIITRKTNTRKIIFGDSFRIIPFYESSLRRAISKYLEVDESIAESIIMSGIENIFTLQVGDLISLPIKDQNIKSKLLNARNLKIKPIDQIDRIICSLCGGTVKDNICQECGFHYS